MTTIQDLSIYSVLCFLLMLISIKVSLKLNLLDFPNERKIHLKPTPYTGGVVLSLIYLFSLKFFNIQNNDLNVILSIAFLMAIVGLIDDKYKLNTGGKLSLQIIPIFYMIVIQNINLIHIGDYGYFKLNLNSFSIPFTLLCVLFLINAFNYFDGIDGSLSFTLLTVLLILYFLTTDNNSKSYIIIIVLPVCIFLVFNLSLFKLPKIFLGDSGSLLLGFIISFTLIHFANNGLVHPILLAWSVSIFVYEFISINLQRMIKNKKLFEAGHDHLHHFFFRKTKSIFYSNLSISIINVSMFACGYVSFTYFNALTSFILFLILFIIFFVLRMKFLFDEIES